MKILFLIDSLEIGGAEKSLFDIARTLKSVRPIFFVLSNQLGSFESYFQNQNLEIIKLLKSIDLNNSYGYRLFKSLIADIRPDLIHATLINADLISRKLSTDLNIPVINSLVNNTYCWRRYSMEPLNRKIKLLSIQAWDAFTARRVNLFISNSNSIRQSYSSATGVTLDRIRTIYRGRSPVQFERVTKHQIIDLKNQHGLTDKIIFLNISRMITRKKQQDLLISFSQVSFKDPKYVLIIVGSGPEEQNLRQLSISLGIFSKVIFLGTSSEVPLLMHVANYFVFPSLFEGLPGVLIEAMFSRLPIIASDIPENKECVDEHMAVFHKPGDANDLAKAMLRATELLDWDTRIEKAYQKAIDQFDIQKIALQYEETYTEVLQKFKK